MPLTSGTHPRTYEILAQLGGDMSEVCGALDSKFGLKVSRVII